MIDYFLSSTDYELGSCITFPYKEVLGLTAYPLVANNIIRLQSIEHFYSLDSNENMCLYARLYFGTTDNKNIMYCTTPNLNNEKDEKDDYCLNFIATDNEQGCGCMVVTPKFLQWLAHIPKISSIDDNALMLNPTYVYTTANASNKYVKVNNQVVKTIYLDNAYIDENKVYIANKPQSIESDNSEVLYYMKSLDIIAPDGSVVTLKGKSIGFTIGSAGVDGQDQAHCRVSISTEDGYIAFKDQSKDV